MALPRLLVSLFALSFMWNAGTAANEPTASEKAAMATVEKVHPRWREVASSYEFKGWLSTQPQEVRGLVADSWDPKDVIRVLDLYKAHQRKIPGPGTFADGLTAYDRGDYSRAFSVFLSLAAGGNANAQYNVGVMYDKGLGVSKDERPAMFWYRKAAEQGRADAQFNLGLMYDMGRGVPKDDQQAMSWYRKAAEQGRADAQFNLGLMYDMGRGVPKDDQLAYFWWLLASVRGDADAVKARDRIESRITPEQRAAAQAKARDWKPKSGK